jgi:hypothetical protein
MTQAEPHHARPVSPRWPQAPQHTPATGSPRQRARRAGEQPQSRQQAAGRRLPGELLPGRQHYGQSLSPVSLHGPGAAALNARGR